MTPEQSKLLFEEVAKLNPSPVIELYELDTRPCGDGDVLFFHNGTGGYAVPVVFKGQSYTPIPIRVTGFELTGTGEPPRPTMSILNAGGFMSAAVLKLDDLIGAKLTRRRTFARFLDGESDAAPVEYPIDLYVVVQKTREDRLLVEFELGTGLDLDGVVFPPRTIQAQYCQHAAYRGEGCRFSGEYVVSGEGPAPANGMLNFTGSWDSLTWYQRDDTVFFVYGGVSGIYKCIAAPGTSISGNTSSPADSSKWTRLQRYRGMYNAATTDYVINDVVKRIFTTGPQLYIAIRNTVPVNTPLSNTFFWRIDSCGKSLTHCKWRFDPRRLNQLPLPFGGFPGTLTIPEV